MNELQLLERAFPAPDSQQVAAAEARAFVRYRDASPVERPRTHHRRTFGWTFAAIAVATTALVVLALTAGDDSESTAVARALNGLAATAERQSPAGRNAYAYRRTQSDYGATSTQPVHGRMTTFGYHTPEKTEEWQSATGDLVRCTREGVDRFDSAADRRTWEAAGKPAYAASSPFSYEHFHGALPVLVQTRVIDLPTTVAGIARIMSGLRVSDAGAQLSDVRDLLAWTQVAPEARAAIFRYLATVPGLTVIPHARTHLGRPGVGIGVAGNGLTGSRWWVERLVIFDPETSNLIGYREIRTGHAPYSHESSSTFGSDRAWEDYFDQGAVSLDHVPPLRPTATVSGKPAEFAVGKAAVTACASLRRP